MRPATDKNRPPGPRAGRSGAAHAKSPQHSRNAGPERDPGARADPAGNWLVADPAGNWLVADKTAIIRIAPDID